MFCKHFIWNKDYVYYYVYKTIPQSIPELQDDICAISEIEPQL